MDKLISPTGGSIREDEAGSGGFGAPRGNRFHDGIDWLCVPGDDVQAPCDCRIMRIIYPYGDDLSYRGAVLEGKLSGKVFVIMFYVDVKDEMVGKILKQGDVIGKAQDVTARYPNQGMKPHVHMSVYKPYNYRRDVIGVTK